MRKMIILLCMIFFIPYAVKAQILNISDPMEKLSVPAEFLQSIYHCYPYRKVVISAPEGVVTKMVYKVIGLKDNKCAIQIDGFTNVDVHITQECLFSDEQAKSYALAVGRFMEKGYYPHKHMRYIEADPDYIEAKDIMTNDDICLFHRDGIDATKQFREKLADCTPYEEVQKLSSVDIKRQILENTDDICRVDVIFTQRMPNFKLRAKKIPERMWSYIDKFKEANYHFSCKFNTAKRSEYLKVLEAMIVPEEDGFDFSAVQRFSQDSEMEFIRNTCDYVGD